MEKNIPLLVSVTGWSGSGKTSFCEKLIVELISRGKSVAAAKNAHQRLQIDKEGSDSDRYFKAGASAVCLNTENSSTVFYQNSLEDGNKLYYLFPEVDVIIAEGFKAEGALRIELCGLIDKLEDMKNPITETDIIIYGNENLAARLSDNKALTTKLQIIHWDDIISVADLISKRI